MGILDVKERFIDTIITQVGRRQLAQGGMRVTFVSFTDAQTFYESDVIQGSSDPANRLFLEATSLPADQIVFEADDSGRLVPFPGSELGVIAGKVLSGSTDKFLKIVEGSEFASTSDRLLDSSINNFQKLYALKNKDVVFEENNDFVISLNEVKFAITSNDSLAKTVLNAASINDIESLFQDKKLIHAHNFKYLPPINKPDLVNSVGTPLGDYPLLGQRKAEYSYDELKHDLLEKQFKVIEFLQTSQQNNIVCQLFEKSSQELLKLDIIDYGEVVTDDLDRPEKHIFFAGKIFIDDRGTQTFVNMFTLVFD